MPPFVPRKRQHSPSPPPSERKRLHTGRPKATLFDDADTPTAHATSLEENQRLLANLNGGNGSEDESSISEIDSDEFEDIPPSKRQKPTTSTAHDNDDSENEDFDWEDAIGENKPNGTTTASSSKAEPEVGDISIALNEDGSYVEPLVSFTTKDKKGPSKRERQIRILSHCLHAQSLMWHNTIRNSWANDKEVQKLLLDGLPSGVKREIGLWKEAMGLLSSEELKAKKQAASAKHKGKQKRGAKEKRGTRDWGYEAEHLEQGVPDLSRGDPLLRLLKILASYWRKHFTVTTPALRKRGYLPLRRLKEEIDGWKRNPDDVEERGERIPDRATFRKLARSCEGSRDVGAQLFVALLRGLGLDTRLVANLQPVGIGWSKAEDADLKRLQKASKNVSPADDNEPDSMIDTSGLNSQKSTRRKAKSPLPKETPSRKSERGNQAQPINVDDSESPLSDPPSEDKDSNAEDSDDDLSVVDVTPIPPRTTARKPDRDMAFPNYWTEVCSPISHKWIPVDPIVLSTIASNEELLQTFEPRGKKAEVAKQVICYTIAFAADGSAKDVTVRYLKKHQLPGKTKGMRVPISKTPVYNRHGKIKRFETYDWFHTMMSVYDRPKSKRTQADDLEDRTDLKPYKPTEGGGKEVAKESLQWYKQSAEFVLEQHLRREEALKPGSEPVKTFTSGKGDKMTDHLVYNRADVVNCKTVESWHKEGRAIKMGAQPIKFVPMRAVTLVRKREIEDAQRETGEKLKQGLYSKDQTDWIIPPPIKDGVIPKNAFGNMDVYVPTMVPKGAIHLPLKGSAKLCRKLEIDYAEACTGFEFGKQRAVPVLTGVVVAKENAGLVRDAWRKEQEEVKRKEDSKRTGIALQWWRKMVMGMRILERMKREYEQVEGGARPDEINPFVNKAIREGRSQDLAKPDNVQEIKEDADGGGGGFFLPGHEEKEVPQHRQDRHMLEKLEQPANNDDVGMSGGFLVDDDDGASRVKAHHSDELLVEDNSERPKRTKHEDKPSVSHMPLSLHSMHAQETSQQSDLSIQSEPESSAEDSDMASAKRGTRKSKATNSRKGAIKEHDNKPQSRRRGRPPKRAKRATDEDDDDDEPVQSVDAADDPPLSDISPESDKEEQDEADDLKSNASVDSIVWKRSAASPRVLIASPTKQSIVSQQSGNKGTKSGDTTKQAASKARNLRSSRVQKFVKSRYFGNDEEDRSASGMSSEAETDASEDEDQDEEDEEDEVVVPRRTTARTRSKK